MVFSYSIKQLVYFPVFMYLSIIVYNYTIYVNMLDSTWVRKSYLTQNIKYKKSKEGIFIPYVEIKIY